MQKHRFFLEDLQGEAHMLKRARPIFAQISVEAEP